MRTDETTDRDLRDDIARDRLELYYQPQIEPRTGAVVAVEALSRWTHERLGPIPPGRFVAIAEAHGAIHPLGESVLARACRFGRSSLDRGRRVEVAINVSPLQLATSRFFDVLERELADTGMPAGDLTLEITESRGIADYRSVAARLAIIRRWGVTVSIDDYGTGHSSMRRALALHVDELKLDRSVVARADRAEIAATVQAAHGAGMRVVAEGVETAGHLALVRALGCDRAQGFHISRPLRAEEFDRWSAEYTNAAGR